MTPLWKDAIARVMTREKNDLSGALKRYAGKPKEFEKWVKTFYEVDHPAFIKKQFQPIREAQSLLMRADAGEQLDEFIQNFLFERMEQVRAKSADVLVESLAPYTEQAGAHLLSGILGMMEREHEDTDPGD
jgi:hypothetical protein